MRKNFSVKVVSIKRNGKTTEIKTKGTMRATLTLEKPSGKKKKSS